MSKEFIEGYLRGIEFAIGHLQLVAARYDKKKEVVDRVVRDLRKHQADIGGLMR